jgi:hypothetical protein
MRHIARQPRGEIRGQDTYCSKFSCLALNGPIDQLRTNYSSDPSLPAADIINLLAFGKIKGQHWTAYLTTRNCCNRYAVPLSPFISLNVSKERIKRCLPFRR